MAKAVAERSQALSIFWLKEQGLLDRNCNYNFGGITWTYGMSEEKSSIGFSVMKGKLGTPEETTQMELHYISTNRWTGEKDNINYRVDLTTSHCNYGGVRYWFICPLNRNGQYCGRRVGVLYSTGKYYGCRKCANITYNSQMRGGRFRGSSVTIPDMDRLEKEIKRYYYNGKPTRKYRRLMVMDQKLGRSFIMMAARFKK